MPTAEENAPKPEDDKEPKPIPPLKLDSIENLAKALNDVAGFQQVELRALTDLHERLKRVELKLGIKPMRGGIITPR